MIYRLRTHIGGMISVQYLLLACLFLFTSACASQTGTTSINTPKAEVSVPEVEEKSEALVKKHPLDKAEFRRLVLDNGLKALLVSDPRFNKSAASMVIEAGSLSNPPERQGLAHFLEHMLFLGTEKYPGVDDYSRYMTENGGYNNAYTAGDHTNYFFEVNHDAYDGALDRFAQFFIGPLFTPEYTERELNAVHSEHQKNLENDAWRTMQVQRTLYREDHPASMFSTGSLETLNGTDRETLINFYRTHYSANRMNLVILGKAPLDTLEQRALRHFSSIKNSNLSGTTYAPDYLPEKETFRLIQVNPVKDIRSLELEFPLPALVAYYDSKPTSILGSLIGHEGKGSLLSLLKREDLATGLSAGGSSATRDYGGFGIRIALTSKGLEHYREVTRLCLTYIEMLKQAEYPGYHFQEMATMARLNEIYSDRGEGGGYATHLAGLLALYPLEIAERIPYLYEKEDPEVYRKILSYLRPDNMLVTLTAKDLPTTDTEPYYGAPYSYTEDDAFYETFSSLPSGEALHLPEPNPFIPAQASIPDRSLKEDVIPEKIIDEAGLVLYHSEDFEFLRPKVSLRYKIRFPVERMNLRFKVLLDLYTACVNESLNELAYPASLAGLNYSFANGYEGVYFSINGFDESAPRLFQDFLDHMRNLEITEEAFAGIQDRMIRGLKNFPKQDAWRIASFYNGEIMQATSHRHTDRLGMVEQLGLPDMHAFVTNLYDRIFIEALVHGNITAEKAILLSRQMQETLGGEVIPQGDTFEQAYLLHPDPEAFWVVEQLEVNNSCFWRDYYMGSNTPENRARALILNAFLDRPFFTEMRTNQQLGYIVWSGARSASKDHIYFYFVIQSGTHSADVLEDRADAFISTFTEQFRDMPQEVFERFKASVAEELKKKEKTIAEKAAKFNTQAFDYAGDFERNRKTLNALEGLTREDVGAVLEESLAKDTRRMRTILAFAREHKAERQVESSFEDLTQWKKARAYK